MSYELEYFTEFLENPSALPLGEFYRMFNAWAKYIGEHKGDFNYLEDDEWKEIRERLIAEFPTREAMKADVDDEWEYLADLIENMEGLNDDERIGIIKRNLDFIKTHQEYCGISDEDIALGEENLAKFKNSVKKAVISEENLRISEQNLDKSLANLDETLIKIYERTGKTPIVQIYQGAKRYKGN